MSTKNFSFKNVSAIFGIVEIDGWAEGDDVLQIEFDEDQFSKTVGAKGDVTRVQNTDSSCTIRMKLLQTSETNAILSGIFTADREIGTGILPFIANDKEAGETYIVNNAWIVKFPNVIRGKGPNVMEWTLHGDFLTPVII